MRIALGCMRFPTHDEAARERARATIRVAFDLGVRVFDTARSYGPPDGPGDNERLVASAIGRRRPTARIFTKCGMLRDGARFVPDGRAAAIARDVRESTLALGSVEVAPPVDVLFLHAPDPAVPLATSLRALARARRTGLARAVGVSNVSRRQLEEARALVPIEAVTVALSPFDDLALRGGVVALCVSAGIPLYVHSPLGGPRGVLRARRDRALLAIGARRGLTPEQVVLAYLLVAVPAAQLVVGARTDTAVVRAVEATRVVLEERDLAELDARFPQLAAARRPLPAPHGPDRDVVIVLGVAGAGKSRLVEGWVERGYERLNRDLLGGTLRGIARRLQDRLAAGATRLVLDNTYVSRASRADVIRVAREAGARVRGIYVDTPRRQIEINVILRMLARRGELLGPEELRQAGKRDPNIFPPHVVDRMVRELDPPSLDEGFTSLETVGFVRAPDPLRRAGVAINLAALDRTRPSSGFDVPADAPCLVFGWRRALTEDDRARARARWTGLIGGAPSAFEIAICPHPPGPRACWCRPPLPGLWLAFAHRHDLTSAASTMIGVGSADRGMAEAVGMRFVEL